MVLKLCAKLTQYNDISFTNLSRLPMMIIIVKILKINDLCILISLERRNSIFMIIVYECLFVSQQFVLHDKISFCFKFFKENMTF